MGDRDEAAAAVKVAEAVVHFSRLNLDFTTVKAPIAGRISKQMIIRATWSGPTTTPLTTIVSLDPIYAYFDIDDGPCCECGV